MSRGIKIKSGALLLAEPFMLDPYFKRAVVLLCEHEKEEGTVGFIINKQMDIKLNELIADFPEFDAKVNYGGPVQNDTLHYVHNVGNLLEDSKKVSNSIWWGGDFDKLKFLIESKLIQPSNIKFYIGYAGWSQGQLNEELNLGSWVVASGHANYLFKSQQEELWKQVMYNQGNVKSVISTIPEDISWN